jgi:hypothetical protein
MRPKPRIVMQLSEKKIIFGESLDEIDFEKLFILLKTLEKTHSSCSQFDVLQDLIEQFDNNFNLQMWRKTRKENKLNSIRKHCYKRMLRLLF